MRWNLCAVHADWGHRCGRAVPSAFPPRRCGALHPKRYRLDGEGFPLPIVRSAKRKRLCVSFCDIPLRHETVRSRACPLPQSGPKRGPEIRAAGPTVKRNRFGEHFCAGVDHVPPPPEVSSRTYPSQLSVPSTSFGDPSPSASGSGSRCVPPVQASQHRGTKRDRQGAIVLAAIQRLRDARNNPL